MTTPKIDHHSGLSFQRNQDDSLTITATGPNKAPAIAFDDLMQVLHDLGLISTEPTDDGTTPEQDSAEATPAQAPAKPTRKKAAPAADKEG